MDPTPWPQHNGRLSPTRSSVGPDLHIDLHIDQHIDFAAFAFPIETIYRAFVFVGCDIICSAYISIETWDSFFLFCFDQVVDGGTTISRWWPSLLELDSFSLPLIGRWPAARNRSPEPIRRRPISKTIHLLSYVSSFNE